MSRARPTRLWLFRLFDYLSRAGVGGWNPAGPADPGEQP